MKTFGEFLIDEAKQVGIVYHFTTQAGIYGLLRDGFRTTSRNEVTFSMTRNFQLPIVHNVINSKVYNFRINIDGNKLSNKVKVRPIRGLKTDKQNVTDIAINVRNRVDINWEENEEYIPVGTNIRPYIKSITVIDDGEHNTQILVDMIRREGIEVKVVNKWEIVR